MGIMEKLPKASVREDACDKEWIKADVRGQRATRKGGELRC